MSAPLSGQGRRGVNWGPKRGLTCVICGLWEVTLWLPQNEDREDEDETLTEHLPGTGHSTEGAGSVHMIPV